MTCSGRYAEAWQYASFWCVGSLAIGVHDGVGPADAALSDAMQNFPNYGIEAGKGMVLYNTTAGTNGLVTAVGTATVTAAGVTWDNGDAYRIVGIDAQQIAQIEHYLNITAGNIHAARAAAGACDCTLGDWATGNDGFLTKINIIEAGAFHHCPCARAQISDEERRLYLEWSNDMLGKIRSGELDVCADSTGSLYPSVGWAELGLTSWNRARIIANRLARTGG